MSPHRPAFCGLMPHPPVVVPEVGRERLAECQQTWAACRTFARRLVAAAPDRLFLVSPHAPSEWDAFGLWQGRRLWGDLGSFEAKAVSVDLPNDEALVAELEAEARRAGLLTWRIPAQPLDHGSVVPLYFLCEAGWHGPTAVASLPLHGDPVHMAAFGRAVGVALGRLPGRGALVASGDLTHRATRDAPYGFDARGLEFDLELTALVRAGRLDAIARIDPRLRDVACEDAADAATVVATALGETAHGSEVLSYEHPLGVGYLVAVFHDGQGGGDGDEAR